MINSNHIILTPIAPVASVSGPPAAHPTDPDALTNPVVVFEVLSKSTEAFDRGDKLAYYPTFVGLETVVLISQTAMRVERYHRGAHGVWGLTDLSEDQTLDLSAIGISLKVSALYAGA